MSADARSVAVDVLVAEGVYLNMTRDLEVFGVRIGQWRVTLINGNLEVREFTSAGNEAPLLRVPA